METYDPAVRDLRRVIRDLVALATMPAGWVGREPAHVAQGVAEMLMHTLRAEAVCVWLESSLPGSPVIAANGCFPEFAELVSPLRLEAEASNVPLIDTIAAPNWPARLRVSIQPIGIRGDQDFVAVGCSRNQFPNETESLLLSVAANQAAVALQTSRLLDERRASEQAALRAQEELSHNQEKLRSTLIASQRLAAIVEYSDDAIISKDLNGIVTSWNPCAERMFGYTAAEIIGRPITMIIPAELHEDEQRILETIARGERIEHFETVRVAKSGERLEVSLTISPVKDHAGRILGAAKIARDITQRKKAERALRTSERLASVGRLAATVAHEINNPLEALTNLVYLAKENATGKQVRSYLAGAEEELDRISQLTKQTLGFYRETRGASLVKVGGLVDPLVAVFASRARNKGIEICSQRKEDPEIRAIPGEIRQLLANLLSNSIDAVQPGGRIRIRVSAATEWKGQRRIGVRLIVADSGPGIPLPERSQLFEPFFTSKEVGTGLGLWVCKSIVEKHQGSIRVKSSTTPGKSWTAFSVFLPLLHHQAAANESLRQAV